MSDPHIDLKFGISVQGKQQTLELITLIATNRKNGTLTMVISEGGVVAARFEEQTRVRVDDPLVLMAVVAG